MSDTLDILEKLKEHDVCFEKIDQRFVAVDQTFKLIDQRLESLEHRMDKADRDRHRAGLLAEDTNHKVQLLLEIMQAVSEQKIDRSEFEAKYERHDIRITALEATSRKI